MKKYPIILLCIVYAGVLQSFSDSTEVDPTRDRIDSLEQARIDLYKGKDSVRAKLDSVHNYIRNELKKQVVPDTIVGMIENDGSAYNKPDIVSKKKFKVKAGETVVIIGFWKEWFKVIHKKGFGFVLEDVIKHSDKVFLYKKEQMKKYSK